LRLGKAGFGTTAGSEKTAGFKNTQPNGHGKSADRPPVTGNGLHELVKPTEDFIRQYPEAALATAFLVGVVIAWWIKRK
jgi:hypothetical protein